ncbi:MAG: SDR family oxidoreductase [Cyclobacteriaceae bacterium]
MTETSVSILGCGWLGFPLAKALVSAGYRVRGSTTSSEKLSMLEQGGIEPYLITLNPTLKESANASFFSSEIMVINIPPGRKRENVESFYTTQIREILSQQPTERLIFISSTSVYPDCNQEVQETDSLALRAADKTLKASGKALLMAEDLVRNYSPQATIVRFCGLMGPDRHPGRFLAGRKLPSSGQAPINFIHLGDCIAILKLIVQEEKWGELFNACADSHPTKEKFYTLAAEKLALDPPKFSAEATPSYKKVNNDKLKQHLGYTFIFPDPTQAL